jgi:hypothetical protein
MPLHTAEALIRRTFKLGESDRIVVFLTRDRGKSWGSEEARKRFGGRSSRSPRSSCVYRAELRELVTLNMKATQSPLLAAIRRARLGYFAELIASARRRPDERLTRRSSARVAGRQAAGGGAGARLQGVCNCARYPKAWRSRAARPRGWKAFAGCRRLNGARGSVHED